MKAAIVIAITAALLGGCASTSTPQTAWGKEGVSMLDYRTDAGQCAVMAATGKVPGTDSTMTGIRGQNNAPPPRGNDGGAAASGAQAGAGGQNSSGSSNTSSVPTTSGSVYRESASDDFVNRAAMQQRAQELAAQKARTEALKVCLTDRGYKEFELTAEERAKLRTLPNGSDERREYLYQLGTDPEVLKRAE